MFVVNAIRNMSEQQRGEMRGRMSASISAFELIADISRHGGAPVEAADADATAARYNRMLGRFAAIAATYGAKS